MTGLNSAGIIGAAVDHMQTLGLFESVQGHESVSAPGNGLTADVWFGDVKPAPLMSGLAVSSAILTLYARIYLNADGQPVDDTETIITGAVDQMLAAYSAAFTFGGLVEQIDLLGAYGTALSAVGGYVEVGNVPYRCMTITIPCVIDDVWPQIP
ncbi:hypothetical protein Caci_2844 [Catenulispora acidiphila DSM 44928]|uniref:Uncharacterized protein n=1 Tax=Catenulispora acidiphila (strain DSM 44928 / JCM 14897 / NBRC 102108 / NRRL B-24433 / ID139908) TaxID=479433 RepID=C7Q178_CATAD|nr:hypothetical protein [Catenulispora acidiphila]ACU71753.1 hypothetical protein Caci_2844 [Catenulispora acidiphila DSM 44928]